MSLPEAAGQKIDALLRQVRLLELAARRNVAGLTAGDYLAAVPGRGATFHEARRYLPGDPVRDIAWTITARLGEPYVKVHVDERRRDVVVAVDVSPSMHAGFQRRTKLELAVELAATLALAAVDAGDRIGGIVFADRTLAELRPRPGRTQLFRLLRQLLEQVEPWQRPVPVSDPRAVFHTLGRFRRGRYVVFLISDFVDRDVPEDLTWAESRHDVSLLHVYDPVEHAAGDAVFSGFDPEGRSHLHAVSPGDGGSLAEASLALAEPALQQGIDVASFSTAEPVAPRLSRFFHRRRRRRG